MQLGQDLRIIKEGNAECVKWTWDRSSLEAVRMENGREGKRYRDGKLIQVALEIRRTLVADLVFVSCQSVYLEEHHFRPPNFPTSSTTRPTTKTPLHSIASSSSQPSCFALRFQQAKNIIFADYTQDHQISIYPPIPHYDETCDLNIPGPLTFLMMLRVWSSMNSTRTCVTPPREPGCARKYVHN